MARLARLCIPGWPHLVLQRGHNGQPAFHDDTDRALYRRLLQEAALAHGLKVHAYALLDDEVRLLATPASADALSATIQAIGRRYVAVFNRRHARRGSLWDGRFRGTVVQPEQHLLECMCFVEGATGGDVQAPPWSSAAHHLGIKADPLVTEPVQFWALGNTPFDREAAYRELWKQALTESQRKKIVSAAATGWPLGNEAFVAQLSECTSRRLTPLARGRPRKGAS
jgi:putative transposase